MKKIGGACIIVLIAATYLLWRIPIPSLFEPALIDEGGRPPTCTVPSNEILFGDWLIKFRIAGNVTVNAADSPDSTLFWINAPSSTAKLEVGEGPLWESWDDLIQFESAATNRIVRKSKFLDFDVIDIKARRVDGKRSRLIGTIGETGSYKDASEEDALFFDQIIDAACFNNSFRLENSRALKGPRPQNCQHQHYIVKPQGRTMRRR